MRRPTIISLRDHKYLTMSKAKLPIQDVSSSNSKSYHLLHFFFNLRFLIIELT